MMKKGTKFAALLLSLALIIPACQKKQPVAPSSDQGSLSESQSQSEQVNYTVSISNKQALQAPDWHAKGDSRKVEIEVEPKANVAQLVREGVIQITSSDTEKLTITGQMANPVTQGQATITVTCGQSTDNVEVTIAEEEVAEVVNYGTEQQPLTISQVLTEVAKEKLENKSYSAQYFFAKAKLKGTITGNAENGHKFKLTDGTNDMEVSSAQVEEGKTAADYANGDIITLRAYVRADNTKDVGYYFSYNNGGQSGKNAPQIIGYEQGQGGETVPEPAVETKTLAEFIALPNSKAKAYKVSAEVKSLNGDKYGNMTLTDGTNDLIIYGCTATATALAWNDADSYVFNNPQDFLTNTVTSAIKRGDTLEMKLIRADYGDTIEASGIVLSVTPGTAVDVPEPAVETKTLAEFIALENSKAKAYKVTAEVKSVAGNKYGNMVLTDGTNDLTIYGSTATASALAWNNADAYVFTNPQDFLTNTTTSAIVAGDTVEMKLIRADYQGAIQGSGIVLSVSGQGGQQEQTNVIELTPQSFLGYDGSATIAYSTEYQTSTVSGVTFRWQQISVQKGNNYAGIQFRNKLSDTNNGTKSNFNNTTAFGAPVEKITFNWASNKNIFANNNALKVTFGKENTFASNTEVKMVSTVADQKTFEVAPTGTDFTFAKVEIDDNFTYSCYFDSIVITLASGEEQQEVLPVGNYLGHATAIEAMGGASIFTMIALGNEKAYIEVAASSPSTKVNTTYTYNAETKVVTMSDDTLGTITAVFDEENHALTQVTLSGSTVAAAIADNGQITLNNAAHYWDCEGTTEQLNQVLAKRVRPSGSWNAALEDVAADTTNFVGGASGAARSGSSDKALGITLRNDFETQQNVQGIGFWVYNPSNADLQIRTWTFGQSYGGASEIGNLTAKANGWTFCRMGFSARNIYNFNICVWNENGQTAEATLTFDNICLY